MKREMTESEKEFFVQSLVEDFEEENFEKDQVDNALEEVSKEEEKSARKSRLGPFRFLKSLYFWAFLILGIGLTSIFAIMFVLARAESLLGEGTLEYLASRELTPDVEEAAASAGITWLSEAITVYQNRIEIIVLIGLITFVLAFGLVLIDFLIKSKKQADLRRKIILELQNQNDSEDSEDSELDDEEEPYEDEEENKNSSIIENEEDYENENSSTRE